MEFLKKHIKSKWLGHASTLDIGSVIFILNERYSQFGNMFKWCWNGEVENLGRCFVLRYHGEDALYIKYDKVVFDTERMSVFISTTNYFIERMWLNRLFGR